MHINKHKRARVCFKSKPMAVVPFMIRLLGFEM